MLFFKPPHKDHLQTAPLPGAAYSGEFPLGRIQPSDRLKSWRSDQNTFFSLAKESSDLVSRLKVGAIVPMNPYSEGAKAAHRTQIAEIVKETRGFFGGPYRIVYRFRWLLRIPIHRKQGQSATQD